jgi:hypothetical protein
MATGIPSHDLAAWTQARISAIYEAQSDTDFQKSFSSAFSSSPEIFINHQNISKDNMKDDIAKRRNAAACGMDVKWENVMVVPKDSAKPDEVRWNDKGDDGRGLLMIYQAGIVAGFLVVNRSLKYRIRAAPAQMQTVLNISAKSVLPSINHTC